jgi:hypothetical protein
MARKNATLVAGSDRACTGRAVVDHAGLSRTRSRRLLRAEAEQPQQALVLRLEPDDSGAELVELDVERQHVRRRRLIMGASVSRSAAHGPATRCRPGHPSFGPA